MILRNSERSDFKRCPQKWYWAWEKGFRVSGPPSDALWFGIGWHLVMAHWYGKPGLRRGRNPMKIWRDYCEDEVRNIRLQFFEDERYDEQKYVDAQALGEGMLANYFDTYGKDETWHVIDPEHVFQVRIPDLRKDRDPFIMAGTYDLVFRDLADDGKLKLGEHKTAKQIMTNHLSMDDQAGTYWAIATTVLRSQGVLKPTERLHGIVYNFARKGLPDERPRNEEGLCCNQPKLEDYRKAFIDAGYDVSKRTLVEWKALAETNNVKVLGEVSKVQPPTLLLRTEVRRNTNERRKQIGRIQAEAVAISNVREGITPLYKTPTRMCSFCQFFDMCEMDEQGDTSSVNDYAEAIYEKHDPYIDHRKSAGDGGWAD